VCVSIRPAATARHINLGGEGNVLYPVLFSFIFVFHGRTRIAYLYINVKKLSSL